MAVLHVWMSFVTLTVPHLHFEVSNLSIKQHALFRPGAGLALDIPNSWYIKGVDTAERID